METFATVRDAHRKLHGNLLRPRPVLSRRRRPPPHRIARAKGRGEAQRRNPGPKRDSGYDAGDGNEGEEGGPLCALLGLPNELVHALIECLDSRSVWQLASTCRALNSTVRTAAVLRLEGPIASVIGARAPHDADAWRAFWGLPARTDGRGEKAMHRARSSVERVIVALRDRMAPSAWATPSDRDRCSTCERYVRLAAARDADARRRERGGCPSVGEVLLSLVPEAPEPPFFRPGQPALDAIAEYARRTAECNAHSRWHARVQRVAHVVREAIIVWSVHRAVRPPDGGAAPEFWADRPQQPEETAAARVPPVVYTASGQPVSSLTADVVGLLEDAAAHGDRLAVWAVVHTLTQACDSRRFLVAADSAPPSALRGGQRSIYYRADPAPSSGRASPALWAWWRARAGDALRVEARADVGDYLAAARDRPVVLWPHRRPRPLFSSAPPATSFDATATPAATEHWTPVRWFVSRRKGDGRQAAATQPLYVIVMDPHRGITPVAVECGGPPTGGRVVLAHAVRLPPATLLGCDPLRAHTLLGRLYGVVSRLMEAVGYEWARSGDPVEWLHTEVPRGCGPVDDATPIFDHYPPRSFQARSFHYVGAIVQDGPCGVSGGAARAIAARRASRSVPKADDPHRPSGAAPTTATNTDAITAVTKTTTGIEIEDGKRQPDGEGVSRAGVAGRLPYGGSGGMRTRGMFEAAPRLGRGSLARAQKAAAATTDLDSAEGRRERVDRGDSAAGAPVLRGSVVCRWSAASRGAPVVPARSNVAVCMLDASAYVGAAAGDMAYNEHVPWLPVRLGAFPARGGLTLARATARAKAIAAGLTRGGIGSGGDVGGEDRTEEEIWLPPLLRSHEETRRTLTRISVGEDGPDLCELAQRMAGALQQVAEAHAAAFDSTLGAIAHEAGVGSPVAAVMRGLCTATGTLQERLVPPDVQAFMCGMTRLIETMRSGAATSPMPVPRVPPVASHSPHCRDNAFSDSNPVDHDEDDGQDDVEINAATVPITNTTGCRGGGDANYDNKMECEEASSATAQSRTRVPISGERAPGQWQWQHPDARHAHGRHGRRRRRSWLSGAGLRKGDDRATSSIPRPRPTTDPELSSLRPRKRQRTCK